MPKLKGDNSFESETGKFGCTTLLLHPMPINWDFSKIKQFLKDQCESEEIKNSTVFIYKETKNSDHVWIQFNSESLCRLAYAKLQGIELNGKRVNIKFDKHKNMGLKQYFDKKPNSNSMNMNVPNNQNNFNGYGMTNYTTPPPAPEMAPPPHDTYGLSVGFLTSLGIQPPMRNKVFVANLVLTVTEHELHAVMSLAGRVTALTLLRAGGAPRGQAAVEYDHPVEAVQAISMLNGQEFFGRPLVVRMYKHEPKLPLPTGLAAVGSGLGPNGEALKAVRTIVEILPLKHRLENAIKRMSGEIVTDDNYAAPYGAEVVDNFNSNVPYGPGVPPFGMPNGHMPFMPYPDGPFMPGPMGRPMPGPMPGPMSGPMPGPMPGPNMAMPGPMPPMVMPGPNMHMPIPGPNMPMPGPNMPLPGMNMPFSEPGPIVSDIKTPVRPMKVDNTKTTPENSIPAPKPEPAQDIPGLSDITLPETPPRAKSPPPLPSNAKKLTLSVKTENMLKARQESPVESKNVEKEKSNPKETTPPGETPRESTRKAKMSESKAKRRRSRSSSPEEETAKSIKADKGSDLTNDLLKLFDSRKPSLDALQGFMEQVISLSKTMSALRDIVPKQPPKEKSPKQDSDWSPERPSKSDHSDTRKKDKKTDVESSRLSKTISALRETEPLLPSEVPPRPRGDWSGSDSPEAAARPDWTEFEIEPPPSQPPEPRPARACEWSAAVPPRSPDRGDEHRKDHKRTYTAADDQEGSRPKTGRTDSRPLITSSDMLTFTNLPPTVSVGALSGRLRRVGALRFAELTGGGRAVVRFQRVRDAERCIKIFHRSKVDGQIIEVTPF